MELSVPKGYKIGTDAWNQTLFVDKSSSDDLFSFKGFSTPSWQQISDEDKWAASTRSPKGYFSIFVASGDAYETDWKYMKLDLSDRVVPSLDKRLTKIAEIRDLYRVHTMGVSIARAMGISVVARIKKTDDPYDWIFHPFLITKGDIKYSDTSGKLLYFQPFIRRGNKWTRIRLPLKDCVIYTNKIDPRGNQIEGMPDINSIINTLTYLDNMKFGYAKTITQRGLGLLLLKIKGDAGQITDDMLEDYADSWGDPSSYSSMVFPEDEMDVEMKEGLKGQFDFAKATGVFSKDISSGTGIGHNRLEGVENARLFGTEISQDNYASVLETIQHSYDPFLLQLYAMADPYVENKFKIVHEFRIRRSKKYQSEVLTMQANAITQLAPILYVNEGRRIIDEKPMPGMDKITILEHTLKMQEKYAPDPMAGGFGKPFSDKTGGGGKPGSKPGQANAQKSVDDKVRQRIQKDSVAKILIQGDVSKPRTNEILKALFGTGKSYTDLVKLGETI